VQKRNLILSSKKFVRHLASLNMGGSQLFGDTASKLRKAGIFSRVDDSNTSIGKRYARNDELGTPFGVTLDFACEYGPDDESAKGTDI
jgi:glycyl-tRNA synthetase (class II)